MVRRGGGARGRGRRYPGRSRRTTIVVRPHLGVQADGGRRYNYNPRVLDVVRQIPRGTHLRSARPAARDRRCGALSSEARADYQKLGVSLADACPVAAGALLSARRPRVSPARRRAEPPNWSAPNTSYIERDAEAVLRGFDDHATVGRDDRRQRPADVDDPARLSRDRAARCATATSRTIRPSPRCSAQPRDVRSTIDAALQIRVASIVEAAAKQASGKAAAIVLDPDTGAVLASVSYPWPISRRRAERRRRGRRIAARSRALRVVSAGLDVQAGHRRRRALPRCGAGEDDIHLHAAARRAGRRAARRMVASGARRCSGHAPARDDRHARRPGPFLQRLLRAARGEARAPAADRLRGQARHRADAVDNAAGGARSRHAAAGRLRPGRRARDAAADGARRRGDRRRRHAPRRARGRARRTPRRPRSAFVPPAAARLLASYHARRGDDRHRQQPSQCTRGAIAGKTGTAEVYRRAVARLVRRASRRTARRRSGSPSRSSSSTPATADEPRRRLPGTSSPPPVCPGCWSRSPP